MLFLIILIICGAFALHFIVPRHNLRFALPAFQQGINLFFFVLITSAFKILKEYLKKQDYLVKAENEQLKTELSLLKAQINPHFLFNTLNNLYGLIIQNQNEKASEVTLKLSDLMRYVLESSRLERVSLRKEIKFIEDYLSLEKIRLSDNTEVRFEVSGIEADLFIPPLLFIPLVENAFKHGLQKPFDANFAHFSLSFQGKELYFEALNSIGNAKQSSRKGVGLDNLKKRLSLLYPQSHHLEFEQNQYSFRAVLIINLFDFNTKNYNKMNVLYQDEFCQMSFDKNTGIHYHVLYLATEDMTQEQFEHMMYIWLETTLLVKATKSIVDSTNLLFPLAPKLQLWVVKEIVPQSLIQKTAFIVPKDFIANLAIGQFIDEANENGGSVEGYFSSLEAAEAWLLKD
ncbi:sensor histidine kinase [Hugenholtzia roseola]|uniref:sensor histidine kinase n=1 Tax=Hugenholtzia roseola TaxID=1002 RepID=UPI0004081096|nr:histidine kinase [Hugenholtzia roseola]